MKKLLTILLAACLLVSLCACGGSGGDASQPEESQPPSAAPEQVNGDQTTFDNVFEMSAEELESASAGYSGVPDLSGLSSEEILERYIAGPGESEFTAYESAMFSPELFDGAEDYPRDAGEWTDYDPGDWVPGEDIVAEIEIDWDAEYGEGVPTASDLPEEFAFLLPDGLRSGDVAMEEDGEFILSLPNRTRDEYDETLKLLKDAGYTLGASELDTMGIVMYEASNGTRSVTLLYQGNRIMVSFS